MSKKIDVSQLNVTQFKKFFIIAICALIVADVFFLLADDYATISKVVLYATPKYLVWIWLFGMLTTHFFFPRKKSEVRIRRVTSFMITALIAVGLLFVGHALDKELTCNDVDFPTLQEKPFYIELSCREYRENIRVDCAILDCQKQTSTNTYALIDNKNGQFVLKYDITQEMKLLLIFFGFISGYFIWPQTIEGDIT